MVMVGPGDIAPFRGFLQKRAFVKQQGCPIGPSMLFFGCRHRQHDFLYEDEMRQFEISDVTRLVLTPSREPGTPKTYVQQAIWAHLEEVWIAATGRGVFLCGEATYMAPDVRQAFAALFQEGTGATASEKLGWPASLPRTATTRISGRRPIERPQVRLKLCRPLGWSGVIRSNGCGFEGEVSIG